MVWNYLKGPEFEAYRPTYGLGAVPDKLDSFDWSVKQKVECTLQGEVCVCVYVCERDIGRDQDQVERDHQAGLWAESQRGPHLLRARAINSYLTETFQQGLLFLKTYFNQNHHYFKSK